MTDKSPFYITTAISYANGAPHLGHAYEAILTDVMARFKRLDGHAVMFLTGTDEHGQKVATTAEKNNMSPREFCDENSIKFKEMTKTLGISNDDFIRTTEERHYAAAQAIWQQIKDNNPDDIFLDKYEGWYSVRDECYFTEDELTDGPNDTKLAPGGGPVEWREESSYFFRLSNYTEKLLELYETHPEFIQPQSRCNEIKSFVKQGLHDLSISRHKDRLSWGIPVPDDPDHVMYVWLDALTNYITALGYPAMDSAAFQKFWPANYHVIGKDITRFHTVYWPAFLMAAGIALPKTVFAHGFINVQGQKMSKSIGNVLSPDGLVETYGLDQTRYFLMREIPHGQDGNFGHEQAVNRINADLANGLGNLAQRTLSMIHKNCDGSIPTHGDFTAADKALLEAAQIRMLPAVRQDFDQFKIHRALETVWRVVADANAYVDEQAPWKLKKEDPARMKTVLYVLAETIRCLALIVQPVMPESAGKMLNQLKVTDNARDFSFISADHALTSATTIDKPEGIFPRIVEEDKTEKVA